MRLVQKKNVQYQIPDDKLAEYLGRGYKEVRDRLPVNSPPLVPEQKPKTASKAKAGGGKGDKLSDAGASD